MPHEDGVATGHWIKVQIKSGTSCRNADGSYSFAADARHFALWSRGVLPVAGIVYDPERDSCVWADITGHLRRFPGAIGAGPWSIRIPASECFTAAVVQGPFRVKMLEHLQRNTAWRAAEMVCSEDEEEQIEGLLALFGAPESRASRLACQVVLARLFRLRPRARRFGAFALARYFPHPEAGWFTPNSRDLHWYCWQVTGDWGKLEFSQLLELVDEDGFERGSYGQAIAVLLQSVYDAEGTLVEVFLDRDLPHAARHFAIGCLEYFGGWRAFCAIRAHSLVLRGDGLSYAVDWALEYLAQGVGDSDEEEHALPTVLDPNQLPLFPGFVWPRPGWLPEGGY